MIFTEVLVIETPFDVPEGASACHSFLEVIDDHPLSPDVCSRCCGEWTEEAE